MNISCSLGVDNVKWSLVNFRIAQISDAEIKNTKEENEELREKIKTLEQTMV